MKRLLNALLAGAMLSAAAGAQAKVDRERAALVGAVKTVRTERAEPGPQGAQGLEAGRVPAQAVTYDERGNVVERVEFNYDGSVSQKFVHTFDAGGRATGYEEYTGALSKPRRHVYVLGERGERVEYKIVQPDDAAGEKLLYKYDAAGRLAEEILQDHKGKSVISRNVLAYDAAGRLVSQTRYDADGAVSSVATVTYDAQGRPAERARREGHILTYRIRYQYDARGRVAEQETVGSVLEADVPPAEAHPPGRVSYVYKDGRPKEATDYAPDGTVRERVVFKYDARGNWVSKTYYAPKPNGDRGQPRRAEYRTITYF